MRWKTVFDHLNIPYSIFLRSTIRSPLILSTDFNRNRKWFETWIYISTAVGDRVQTIACSIARQSERIANDYISYARKARRIKRQLWFNHRCRDLGPAFLFISMKPLIHA